MRRSSFLAKHTWKQLTVGQSASSVMGRKLTEVARPESGMQNGAGVLQGWEALPAPERWSCLIFFETPRLYSQTGYVLGSLCRDLNDKMAHAIQEPSYFGWMPGCDHGIHVSHWGDAWKCKLYGEFKLILKKMFSCCHCCWTKAEEFDEDWSSNIG